MKAINIKLVSFTFAALLLASCSDSTDGPSGNVEKNIVGKEVTSITDAQELASRVINFNTTVTTTKARSRAAVAGPQVTQLSMPAAPKANGNELPDNIYSSSQAGNYVVTSSKSVQIGRVSNTNIYVNSGTLTITNHYELGDNVNIYVLGGTVEYKSQANLNGLNFYIYKDGSFKTSQSGIYVTSNSNFYVEGDFETTADFDNRGKMYVGGSFTGSKLYPGYGSQTTIEKNLTLKNDFKTEGELYVGGNLKAQNLEFGSQVYINGDANISNNTYKTITERANVFIGGNLTAGDFQHNQGSTTNVQGENGLDISKKDVTINGTVNFAGKFIAKTIKLQGTTDFYACGIKTSGMFRIDSNSANLHTGYLKAESIYQCAGSKIYLNDKGYVECEGTYENANNGLATVTTVEGGKALFKANRLVFNGNNDFDLGNNQKFSTCYLFGGKGEKGKIYVDIKEVFNNNITLAQEVVPWGGKNVLWKDVTGGNITKTKCGKAITIPEEKGKELIPEADITYSHKHDISATCVQPYNGKMYMSYHTRGDGHGACIEVFKTENNKTTMLQYLEDKKNVLDFNHLMIDTKSSTPQLYVVGSSDDSGAMLARIDINNDGLLNTDVREIDENTSINPLTVVPLIRNVQKGSADAKNDENCIVRDGDKLLVMSTRGYEVYDPETLNSLGSKTQPGKAKHIAMNGTEMATLYYTSRPNSVDAEVAGKVELFNTGADILNATPSKTIDIEGIAPNNGKNTIAIDGNYIYVCRSGKGLSCYNKNSGAEVWNWSAPLTANTKVPQGYANGVTFDSNYIYLACGAYGLVVLDKNNKTAEGKPAVVAKARCSTKNSANYVTLNNGYIYVAYGKSRMQVFKLVDKGTSSSNTDYNTKK